VSTFLVLGGGGFIGSHLLDLMRRRGERVVAVARRPMGTADGEAPEDALTLDVVGQFDDLKSLILTLRPSCIINLIGGRENGGLEPVWFPYRLARFLAESGVRARLVLVGSAAEYGSPESLPVREIHPLRPVSEYGFAKAVQSWIARALYDDSGLPVMVARVFNVIGPGQSREFLVGSVVAQAVEMALGEQSAVDVGNVATARDFIDVRDVAEALLLLAHRGREGEAYNVCCGRPVFVREILRMVGIQCGLRPDYYRAVQERYRTDVPVIYGSIEKIARDTHWTPTIDLDRTVRDMLGHARARCLAGRVSA
jgi:GDP-4-dehydro-6-deoxy-D-mannose reductase